MSEDKKDSEITLTEASIKLVRLAVTWTLLILAVIAVWKIGNRLIDIVLSAL